MVATPLFRDNEHVEARWMVRIVEVDRATAESLFRLLSSNDETE